MKSKNKAMSKSGYQTAIWEYEKRIKDLPSKFKPGCFYYRHHMERMKYKIQMWGTAIKRIEKRDKRIVKIDSSLKEFLGFSVRKSAENDMKELILARDIFCKYAMEHRIEGNFLADYIGYKVKTKPSRDRLRFTRGFEKNPESRDLYKRFKEYMESRES